MNTTQRRNEQGLETLLGLLGEVAQRDHDGACRDITRWCAARPERWMAFAQAMTRKPIERLLAKALEANAPAQAWPDAEAFGAHPDAGTIVNELAGRTVWRERGRDKPDAMHGRRWLMRCINTVAQHHPRAMRHGARLAIECAIDLRRAAEREGATEFDHAAADNAQGDAWAACARAVQADTHVDIAREHCRWTRTVAPVASLTATPGLEAMGTERATLAMALALGERIPEGWALDEPEQGRRDRAWLMHLMRNTARIGPAANTCEDRATRARLIEALAKAGLKIAQDAPRAYRSALGERLCALAERDIDALDDENHPITAHPALHEAARSRSIAAQRTSATRLAVIAARGRPKAGIGEWRTLFSRLAHKGRVRVLKALSGGHTCEHERNVAFEAACEASTDTEQGWLNGSARSEELRQQLVELDEALGGTTVEREARGATRHRTSARIRFDANPDEPIEALMLSAAERNAAITLTTHPRYGDLVTSLISATRIEQAQEAADAVLAERAGETALEVIARTDRDELVGQRLLAAARLAAIDTRNEHARHALERDGALAHAVIETRGANESAATIAVLARAGELSGKDSADTVAAIAAMRPGKLMSAAQRIERVALAGT